MSRRLRRIERDIRKGKPVDESRVYVVSDEKKIWGVEMTEREALICKERVAGNVWSRTCMVRRQTEIRAEDLEEAEEHFDRVGRRWALEPGEAWVRPIRLTRSARGRALTVNLIGHQNGVGLSRDAALLERMLVAEGHEVRFCEWRDPSADADVNLYLELFEARHLQTARTHIGLFNLEWFQNDWKGHLRSMTQLWAKSLEAHRIYETFDLPSVYTGFAAADMMVPGVDAERVCLHVRGKASQKGTDVVMEAWRRHGRDLPPLIVTSAGEFDGMNRPGPGCTVDIGYKGDDELAELMTRCWFHVCPSETEGWGHYIAEAISAGSLVITTDASPMNEHVLPEFGILVPGTPQISGMVTRHLVDPDALAEAVAAAARKTRDELVAIATAAREHWERRNAFFCERALALLSHL